MLFIYQTVFTLLLILLLPVWLPLALLVPRARAGLSQRLGFLPKSLRARAGSGDSQAAIWVHAASLGEVKALAPVVSELMQRMSGQEFIITCTSQAGLAQARVSFPGAAGHLLLPLDLPWCLGPLLRAFKPKLAILAETEIWPTFLNRLKKKRCLVLVANGRMTSRSLERYRRFHWLFSKAFLSVDLFAMQSAEDAGRVLEMGVSPQKVVVAGNTKFDAGPQGKDEASKDWRKELGLGKEARLWVAGSTRPGEEKICLDAFAALRKDFPDLVLCLAPRHLQRLSEVTRLLEASRLPFATRSALGNGQGLKPAVILLDTLGELAGIYGAAELAVAGGSLENYGGQNPLEPARQGVPVLFGRHMQHFRDPAAILVRAGAARQLGHSSELEDALRLLLADPAQSRSMGAAGRRVCEENQGASSRLVVLVKKMLLIGDWKGEARDWRIQTGQNAPIQKELGQKLLQRSKFRIQGSDDIP